MSRVAPARVALVPLKSRYREDESQNEPEEEGPKKTNPWWRNNCGDCWEAGFATEGDKKGIRVCTQIFNLCLIIFTTVMIVYTMLEVVEKYNNERINPTTKVFILRRGFLCAALVSICFPC